MTDKVKRPRGRPPLPISKLKTAKNKKYMIELGDLANVELLRRVQEKSGLPSAKAVIKEALLRYESILEDNGSKPGEQDAEGVL